MEIILTIFLFVLGAMLGSFAACQVWRIKKGDKAKRSHCMSCGYQLKWYDNVPIISWLCLRGKCRKCGKKIGRMEIFAELGLAVVFVLSYLLWPKKQWLDAGFGLMGGVGSGLDVANIVIVLEMVKFGLLLALLVPLLISFLYDLKFLELPVAILYVNIAIAVLFAGVSIWQGVLTDGALQYANEMPFWLRGLCEYGAAFAILPGLYFVMYKISHEKWVGGGDWILNIALALVLGNFWLATFAMFLSNILGLVAYLPKTLSAKKGKKLEMQIPFGPFLILAFWLIFVGQNFILDMVWY